MSLSELPAPPVALSPLWAELLKPRLDVFGDAPGDAPGAVFNRESVTNELDRRRKAMRRDGDSPLERLLIDRLLSARLQAMYTDMRYAQFLAQGDGTFQRAEFHQKNAERAQRQFLRAVQALATVRRLIAPAQVNIGQNQINVVG